jgi:hypothetical protein
LAFNHFVRSSKKLSIRILDFVAVHCAPGETLFMRALLLISCLVLCLSNLLRANDSASTRTSPDPSPSTWQTLPQGELILHPFASAPFPHPSRENGYTNPNGKRFPRAGHYDDSTIGIFIPANYHAGDEVDYVVHFHGWSNHVSRVMEHYKLPEQFAAANVNAILIVPQGPKDAQDSSGGKLEDPAGFSRMMSEITRFLFAEKKIQTHKIGRIVLSAHSGGYKVTAAVLNRGGLGGNITDVDLLDASYGDLGIFAAWCRNDPSHRLVSLFTDHLANENQQLMGMLKNASVKYQLLDESTITNKQLRARGGIFMHTKGPHDQVPVDYFGRLVKTSSLGR